MWQYIVPPIMFIVALGVLVVFLHKKSLQVPKESLEGVSEKGLLKRFFQGVSQVFLKILENIMQRFKLLSLKMHNKCQSYFQLIRKKREKRKAEREEEKRRERHGEVQQEVLIKKKPPIRKISTFSFRPIIKRDAALPEVRDEKKDKLEEILIERVAANPRDIEAYRKLGDHYLEKENLGDAKECFKQILKLDPFDRETRRKMRELEEGVKDTPE